MKKQVKKPVVKEHEQLIMSSVAVMISKMDSLETRISVLESTIKALHHTILMTDEQKLANMVSAENMSQEAIDKAVDRALII